MPTLYPVIHFKTADGHSFTVKSRTGTNPSPYSVGQTIPILYDPDNPKNMRTNDFSGRWTGAMIAGACLLVFILFDTLALVGPR